MLTVRVALMHKTIVIPARVTSTMALALFRIIVDQWVLGIIAGLILTELGNEQRRLVLFCTDSRGLLGHCPKSQSTTNQNVARYHCN